MSKINSYRDLIVWQKSMALVKSVYSVVRSHFPNNEEYALSSQIRRSCISIPSNIAEGFGRNSTKDYVRFLQIARGSLFELQTQVLISFDLGYIDNEQQNEILQSTNEIEKMLNSLINKVENSIDKKQ